MHNETSIKYKLTNLDISTNFRDVDYYFMKSDFMASFAYWVVYQSPYAAPNITMPLRAWEKYVDVFLTPMGDDIPHKFNYDDLQNKISEKVLESIPEIEALNHSKNNKRSGIVFVTRYSKPNPDDDFIDLGALARNIFYMLLREYITTALH